MLSAQSPAMDDSAASRLFAEVAERNQGRESRLREYSGQRTYQVSNAGGKAQSKSIVSVTYRPPGPKIFLPLSDHGSHTIRNLVFRPLIDHEISASSGAAKRDTAITPANYAVKWAGEAELEGRRCFLLQAMPRRPDKSLFVGVLWVDAEDLAIARVEGHPAKNPSIWMKKTHFIRDYRKIGSFWLSSQDIIVTELRFFGKHTLAINYEKYQVTEEAPGTKAVADLLP